MIDNRTGSGSVGAAIVARAPPDGHTPVLAVTRPSVLTRQWTAVAMSSRAHRAVRAANVATLRDVSCSGMTMLPVEQAAFQPPKMADYGYVPQNGRAALSGHTLSLLPDPRLVERYLG